VLVIEDDSQIRRFLRISLSAEGYYVSEASSGGEGLTLAARAHPDIVILDLGLPDVEGLEVLEDLREWTQVPVMVLTVRDSEEEKVELLDAGADDFLTKPFGTQELLARLRAIRRHLHQVDRSAVAEGIGLHIDADRHQVLLNGEPLPLTGTEYALLRLFLQNAGRVLTHGQILREVWGPEHEDDVHYLRAYVASLRRKIEPDPANPKTLVTEPGVGYRFAVTCA
jgi:two-component system KDP operon response regulator KdpE